MENNIIWDSFSELEKQENIQYMLNNTELECILKRWKKKQSSDKEFLKLINTFIERNANDAGIIIAVKSNIVKPGADNIEFLTGAQKGTIQTASMGNGKKYAMVFTSKECFKDNCNDLSGIIMFLDEAFIFLENKKELNGIVINAGNEEIVLDKIMMRAIIKCTKAE